MEQHTDRFQDINQQMASYIRGAIHDVATENSGIYERLFFGEGEVLQKYAFNFNFGLNYNPLIDSLEKGYDDIAEDIKFFLDNIVAKIIEINMDVNYRKTTRLGGSIKVDGVVIENHYLIDDYTLDSDAGIADLENYVNDIQVVISEAPNGYRYTLSLEIPIYDVKELFLQD